MTAKPIRSSQYRRLTATGLLSCALLFSAALPTDAQERDLPTIGGLGGGLISEQQEAEIGQQVLAYLRRSEARVEDPLAEDYLQSLIFRLLPAVPLNDKNIHLVLIDSPELNAFAVPGNIVGVNAGLFLHANSEQAFSSVVAHELAHLSQRHFARRLEQQQTSTPMALAGMIAGIVLSAVTKSDLGIAAIAGTQALTAQNMLQYSRAHEKEADRIGLEIMVNSGLDPKGMPQMFEEMMRENRLQGNQVPEYLSTHPLTQSRVSDTWARAEQYPNRRTEDTLEYHLSRARLQVHYLRTPELAIEHFKQLTAQATLQTNPAASYGLAVALLSGGRAADAEQLLRDMLLHQPGRITYTVTLAEALLAQGQSEEANQLTRQALTRNPNNFPISDMLARTELAIGDSAAAVATLKRLTREQPGKETLWRRLAEAEGQARNIVGVHQARAEYALLMGDYPAARRQLLQAQDKEPPGTPNYQAITERLTALGSRGGTQSGSN
ncbi:M48 family metalloprotease [Marinobacter zhejiangensis]|uniref:Putative beta-barrel assembly-enhancing protease n=1 Tax=Marinobacter zhejiangensis TaxID=488535 RepID=A0A1I4RKY9_9GAMM|nr:M48 family metalloprotease [Marinobacter zhejiangensis]SFM52922.1 Putative Zn-dependent protease, contains TPR repeats [Marinobacter zhejiangensis]